jgi:peptidoglycan-N-acetylglucosamine deacetylase
MLESADESLVAVPADHDGGAESAGTPAPDATLADLDDGATANAITSPNRAVPTGRRGRRSRRGRSQRARTHADPRRPRERGRGVRVLLALAAALAVIVIGANGAVDGLGLPLFPTPTSAPRAQATPFPSATPTEIEATPTTTVPQPTPPPPTQIPPGPPTPLPPAANLVDLWHRPDLLDHGCLADAPGPAATVVRNGIYAAAPNEVALTFDDGPTPNSTPLILDVLERTHTPATFFVLGRYVSAFPYLLQQEWADGFAIGYHSWDHPDMTTLSAAGVQAQFANTIAAVRDAIGPSGCHWFWRPPYGSYNAFVVSQAQSFGLTTITWDVDPADWSRPGVQAIAARVLAYVHPGAIILMHDGPALREQTAAALPIILQGLKDRGLQPVTLPRLLADAGYPGAIPIPTPTPKPTPTHAPTPTPTLPPTPTPVPTATPLPPTPTPVPTASPGP